MILDGLLRVCRQIDPIVSNIYVLISNYSSYISFLFSIIYDTIFEVIMMLRNIGLMVLEHSRSLVSLLDFSLKYGDRL